MTNIVMEHIILTSLLLIVMITFPVTANNVVATYVYQQREVVANGAMNQLTSTIQQLCYSLSQEAIQSCYVTMDHPLPQTIDIYAYDIAATMDDSSGRLTLSLFLPELNIQINKTMTLSPNTAWVNSEYSSLLPDAALHIEKFTNGTLLFRFI